MGILIGLAILAIVVAVLALWLDRRWKRPLGQLEPPVLDATGAPLPHSPLGDIFGQGS